MELHWTLEQIETMPEIHILRVLDILNARAEVQKAQMAEAEAKARSRR